MAQGRMVREAHEFLAGYTDPLNPNSRMLLLGATAAKLVYNLPICGLSTFWDDAGSMLRVGVSLEVCL